MPKRKPGLLQFLDSASSGRGFKLRKQDHQDVTITSAAIRLPVYRPRDAQLKTTTESRVVTQSRASSLGDIDRLAIRLTFLSLWEKPRFEMSKPVFPKFSSLPAEIQRAIWKFARPDPRVIKLFKSTKLDPCPKLAPYLFGSRAMALEWYRLRFQPSCGRGGTYFDRKRDYIYYGSEERRLLVDPNFAAPRYGWIRDTNRWARDRHFIPNIVVYLDFRDSHAFILRRFMEVSVWCNQYADKVFWVFENELEKGTLVSDLKPELVFRNISRRTGQEKFVNTRVLFGQWLVNMQNLRPWWKRFEPTSVTMTEELATVNQMQRSGFIERFFVDKKVGFSFQGVLEG